MSDSTERPAPEGTPPTPSSRPAPPGTGSADGTAAKPETQPSNPVAGASKDPTEALKRGLAENRLPADLKEQILAELPPPEEQERLYRELMEKGGLSFEQFFDSLCAEFEERP
jgi:hypothetical protein